MIVFSHNMFGAELLKRNACTNANLYYTFDVNLMCVCPCIVAYA